MFKKTKSVIFLVVSLIPIITHANWVQVGTAKNVSLYLDPSKTASPDPATKKAIILLSYNSKQQVDKSNSYFSVASQIEADCQKMNYKIVANIYYAAQMGRGEIVDTSNIPAQEQEVRQPAQNSVLGDVIANICSKK